MMFEPHAYQSMLIERIVHDEGRGIGVMIDLGMGKTAIALTAAKRLLRAGRAKRVLVIAPARVADSVWPQEAEKWDHTRDLSVVVLSGDERKRLKALSVPADITVISRNLVEWIVEVFLLEGWPFDTLIIDELSGFKDSKTVRFKRLCKVLPRVRRVIGLTGTPMPKDVGDLWSQVFLLDRGRRLGACISHFRRRWMSQNPYTNQWTEKPGAREEVENLISDICVSLRAKDYLDMPPLLVLDIHVDLDAATKRLYRTLERHYCVKIASGEVTAANAAVLASKLLQLASGRIYADEMEDAGAGMALRAEGVNLADRVGYTDSGRKFLVIHNKKIDVLLETLAGMGGASCLVYYQYRHELALILQVLANRAPDLRVGILDGADAVEAWNARKYDVLLAHPASAGYGLNLQDGGRHMIWYTIPWSLQQYQQAMGRLWRQGQTGSVVAHRIIARGTIDERVAAVLGEKGAGQERLLEAIRAQVRESGREAAREIRYTASSSTNTGAFGAVEAAGYKYSSATPEGENSLYR
jgi:SNF2 family DNA or RNA helicase